MKQNNIFWNGFKKGVWQNEINVRDFIQTNYNAYTGDSAFLAGATDRTKEMMKKVKWMEERGTHNMDGIMEFLLKDSKKPVKTERKRTRK